MSSSVVVACWCGGGSSGGGSGFLDLMHRMCFANNIVRHIEDAASRLTTHGTPLVLLVMFYCAVLAEVMFTPAERNIIHRRIHRQQMRKQKK